MWNKLLSRILTAMLIIIGATSCSLGSKISVEYPYGSSVVPNYDDHRNWASLPFKRDLSDSISDVYKHEINEDLCDVFYLHPTSFTEDKYRKTLNASLDDTLINLKTDQTGILYQSSIFNGIGRIYAPRYRQAHIYRYYDNGPGQLPAFELAYQDVKRAFLKYVRDWNEDRPIIIAAHSQGTTHAVRLVKELLDGHALGNKVVYMYLIGMPVKKKEFKQVKPCLNDSSTNCFYSWRTFRRGYSNEYTDEKETSISVTNPVNISVKNEWTKKSEKRDAILWKYNIAYKNILESRIMGDMLWITRPKFKGGIIGVFMKNYHAGDFNLFYGDIRVNIRERLKMLVEINP